MSHADFKWRFAGHERRARWTTRRADMKIRKTRALTEKFVDVRCLEKGMPVTTKIAISLIVGHDQDNIGRAVVGLSLIHI